MQLSLVRIWSTLKDFSNIDLNSEFQNIRQWWNDHDSGARSWTVVNSNLFIGPTKGTTTNDMAAAGNVGEYIESIVSSVNFPSSGNFGDVTSISLTSGDWDVSFVYEYKANGSTHSGDTVLGISTTSGNSSTGLVPGSNRLAWTVASGTLNYTGSLSVYRMSLSSTTTVYMKYSDNYSIATPFIYARFSARRVR